MKPDEVVNTTKYQILQVIPEASSKQQDNLHT